MCAVGVDECTTMRATNVTRAAATGALHCSALPATARRPASQHLLHHPRLHPSLAHLSPSPLVLVHLLHKATGGDCAPSSTQTSIHPLLVHRRSRPLKLCADNCPFSLIAYRPRSSSSPVFPSPDSDPFRRKTSHTHTHTYTLDPNIRLPWRLAFLIASSSVLHLSSTSPRLSPSTQLVTAPAPRAPPAPQNFFVRPPTSPRPSPAQHLHPTLYSSSLSEHDVTTAVVALKGPPVIV